LTVKCPKCDAEIDHLHYFNYELMKADVSIQKVIHNDKVMNYLDYDSWDNLCVSKDDPEYCCPECDHILFTSEAQAEAFLRGQLIYIILA